jgi:hypothetical protein
LKGPHRYGALLCKDNFAICEKDCLLAHETGHGKSTSMSLQSGVGGHEYRMRELDLPWAFTPDKTRTRDKGTNLELSRKFPNSFALHVVLKELLWLRLELRLRAFSARQKKPKEIRFAWKFQLSNTNKQFDLLF